MAKVYDLTSHLTEEKPRVKIGDKEYEINNGFKTLLEIDKLSNNSKDKTTTEFIDEFMVLAFGKKKAKEIMDQDYSVSMYTEIMKCVQASYDPEGDEESPSK